MPTWTKLPWGGDLVRKQRKKKRYSVKMETPVLSIWLKSCVLNLISSKVYKILRSSPAMYISGAVQLTYLIH